MIIHPPEVTHHDGQARVQARIEHQGGEDTLWFGFDKKYLEFVPVERLDPFLVGLLFLGMKNGEDIHLKGPVSEKLLFSLSRSFMPIAIINNPDLSPIEVTADEIQGEVSSAVGTGVVTGFSGGVDSLCAVHDHFVTEESPAFRLTHLIFNNVGSHGEFEHEKARDLFHVRHELARGLPEKLGLEFIMVDSNLSAVLKMVFQQTHIPRNVCCALLFQKLFRKYYYAASIQYGDAKMRPTMDMCAVESSILHLLSTENLEVILTGGRDNRVEKTRRGVLVPGAEDCLNVCVAPMPDGGNCSACKKCMRTILTLEILREAERFGGVFDMEKWEEIREGYVIGTMLRRPGGVLIREMRAYAKEVGYTFPASQRFVAGVRSLVPSKKDFWVKRFRRKLIRMKRARFPRGTS